MEKNTIIISKTEVIERFQSMKSKIGKILYNILTSKDKNSLQFLNENYPNFISLKKEDNTISYITNKKSEEFLVLTKRDNQPIEEWYKLCWIKSRQHCKISRFISLLIKNLNEFDIKEKDIQDFVQEWGKFLEDDKEFLIVKGKDIKFWYNNVNYANPENVDYGGSTLWKSCMAHSSKNNYMELYSVNPQFSLLILKDSKNKIWGRALLIESENLKVMDRVYFINEYILERFRDWARKNGFIQKNEQRHDSFQNFLVEENGKEIVKKLELHFSINELPKNKFYPYVDTFFYLYNEKLILSNYKSTELGKRYLELRNAGGTPSSEQGYCEHNQKWFNYSDLKKCFITNNFYHYSFIVNYLINGEEKTIYKDLIVPSKHLKRNLLKTEAIKVLFDNDWVTEGDVVFSKFHNGHILKNKSIPNPDDKNDFVHSDKMVYSIRYKKHILMTDNVVKTINGVWMYDKDCEKINGYWMDKKEIVEILDKESGQVVKVSKKHLNEEGSLNDYYRSIYIQGEVINKFRNAFHTYTDIKDLYYK